MRLLALPVVLASVVLTGCGPLPTPSAAPSPSPAASEAESYEPPHDGNPHPENEAYRERLPVADGVQVDPRDAIARATAALEEFAVRVPQPTSRQVVEALVAAGFPSGQVQAFTGPGNFDTPSTAHAVGIDLGGLCITGGLRDGVVELEVAGGYIADGGCLAMSGH